MQDAKPCWTTACLSEWPTFTMCACWVVGLVGKFKVVVRLYIVRAQATLSLTYALAASTALGLPRALHAAVRNLDSVFDRLGWCETCHVILIRGRRPTATTVPTQHSLSASKGAATVQTASLNEWCFSTTTYKAPYYCVSTLVLVLVVWPSSSLEPSPTSLTVDYRATLRIGLVLATCFFFFPLAYDNVPWASTYHALVKQTKHAGVRQKRGGRRTGPFEAATQGSVEYRAPAAFVSASQTALYLRDWRLHAKPFLLDKG
ncbi:predicted protein [Plenodomus lingam JN3]|uniref:Predicted protein n=1 Tax=Leptosphaeria maculans (strain JN3 / isolate v23.1.3 / race Av1-4-5-6-7-8) TaxID=985895 RepID=E5A3M1_LEPMJ|nr:predicted protein [Plenodomus lingam JN3]CBX98234.1 predicted protein [Plenodomus lingam JN3]